MAISAGFTEFACDLFSGIGPVRVRRMFGGAGLYNGDAMFALLYDEDTIFLRGDAALGAELEELGCRRFVYDGKSAPVAMPYWTLPEDALEDPELAAHWARRSLPIAEAAAREKRAKTRVKARPGSRAKTGRRVAN
ncbi:MAG: TfoX/Sxy family protein [Pseudomonadota bacterium]